MLNSIEAYAEAGKREANARINHDFALVAKTNDWLRRAVALERPEDREEARQAYLAAYFTVSTEHNSRP
jgi:hypothetical protein